MWFYLVALLALSADAALDSSAATIAAATSTVTIGSGSSFWSAMPSIPSSYSVAVGDKLRFQYNNYHNLYLMESEAKYASCDFSGATELASASKGGGSGSTPNLYEAVVTAAGTLHFACQKGGHCQANQKVTITAAAAAASPSSSPSPPLAPPPDADNDSSDAVDAALIIGPVLGGVALLALAAAAALMYSSRATRARARATAPAAAPPASATTKQGA